MRPDEHKQKKSAQYKKKHGIDKKDSKPKQENHPETKVKDDDPILPDKNVQTFSRRKVQSNWQRYDEPEQLVTLIGEDYDKVLASSSKTGSHFRLKEEKEWDFDMDFEDVLSIDTAKIAEALSQLTFCEKFDFNPKDFDPELLQAIDGDPADDEGGMQATCPTFVPNMDSFDFQLPKTNPNSLLTTELKTESEDRVPATVDPVKECSEIKQTSEADLTSQNQDPDKACLSKVSANLLSADEPKTKSDTSSVDKAVATLSIPDDLESELDDLLSDTVAPTPKQQILTINKPPLKSSEKVVVNVLDDASIEDKTTSTKIGVADEQDLDDWLDELIS